MDRSIMAKLAMLVPQKSGVQTWLGTFFIGKYQGLKRIQMRIAGF